jgi:hypothetical protein
MRWCTRVATPVSTSNAFIHIRCTHRSTGSTTIYDNAPAAMPDRTSTVATRCFHWFNICAIMLMQWLLLGPR